MQCLFLSTNYRSPSYAREQFGNLRSAPLDYFDNSSSSSDKVKSCKVNRNVSTSLSTCLALACSEEAGFTCAESRLLPAFVYLLSSWQWKIPVVTVEGLPILLLAQVCYA